MFAELTKFLTVGEVAELWSKEAGEPTSLIEKELVRGLRVTARRRKILFADPPSSQTNVNRSLLLDICEEIELPPPKFWFGQVAATARAETECRKWLARQIRTSPKTKSKDNYYIEAKDAVGEGLSRRAFDRAWKEVASVDWKKAGRPPKSPR